MTIIHEEISRRARQIWEREGCPEGRDQEHWLQAEAELRQESLKGQNGANFDSQDAVMLKASGDVKMVENKPKKSVRGTKAALS